MAAAVRAADLPEGSIVATRNEVVMRQNRGNGPYPQRMGTRRMADLPWMGIESGYFHEEVDTWLDSGEAVMLRYGYGT